jgi:hypothetical protein
VTEPTSHQPDPISHERVIAVDEALNQIRDSLRGLRFGSVNVIVQDGVVIQIESEQCDLTKPAYTQQCIA